ncbi:hypothetical protein [Streptomyces sp. WAC01280]|uniref:hypothetical protein n=1 Tax=Streptomyces sp. WAC01280 TaxID=2487424 RepID=UPI000F7B3CD1|nr:hypothetical protein [Streptomyces sp. WAC01280]RSS50078.1 hypothetical protein EF909_39205 [Streptomyces sp. WAC01280]
MSTTDEVRGVTRGSGAALTALWSGSMVLLGKVCGCVPAALRWGWDQASVDTEATAAVQAEADKKAKAKAAKAKTKAKKSTKKADVDEDDDEDQEDEPEEEPAVTAPPVAPVRRPFPEAAGMFVIGGILAAGTLGTVVVLAGPYVRMLAPWKGVIATVGGLAWMVAAWMLAPPPAPAEEDVEEVDEQEVDELSEFTDEDQEEGETPAAEPEVEAAAEAEPEPHPSDRLVRHVLGELASLEKAGKAGKAGGIHVTALIASAEKAELLVPGTADKTAMRQWLETNGFPVTKSVKVRGDVDYGVRVDRVREALGMGLGEALARLSGGGVQTAPQPPAQAPAEAPEQTPAEVPLPAAAVPAQARLLTLVKPLPEGSSQGSAQGVA